MLVIATLCASPLTAQTRYQFVAGDSASFVSMVSPPVVLDPGPPEVTEPEGTVEFGFDYSALGIPESPRFQVGDVATTGLALGANQSVNNAGNEDTAGVWTNATFSGNYRVEVDVFYYIPGSTGSTENMVIGINVADTTKRLNYDQDNDGAGVGSANASPSGLSGYMMDYAADAGLAGVDLFFMYGVPDTLPSTAGTSPINGVSAGFNRNPTTFGTGLVWADSATQPTFSDPTANNARNAEEAGVTLFTDNFPFPIDFGDGFYPGHMSGVWTSWRFEWIDGVLTVSTNQQDTTDQDPGRTETGWLPLFTYDDPADAWNSGHIYLGIEDFFGGSVNPFNLMIYDNLVVTPLIANGDANGDGTIDVADVTSIYNFLAGITGAPAGDGDVVAPAGVDAADAAAIQNFIVNGTPF